MTARFTKRLLPPARHGALRNVALPGLLIVWFLLPNGHLGAGQEDLLEQVRVGNRASLAMIDSMYARVESFAADASESQAPKLITRSEYWRSGGFEKVVEDVSPTSKSKTTILIRDGTQREITAGKDKQGRAWVTNGYITNVGEYLSQCNAWREGLCALPGPYLTFEELLGRPHTLTGTSMDKVRGVKLVKVSLSDAKYTLDIWFDPAANQMVRQVVCQFVHTDARGKRYDIRHEYWVTSWQELQPSVYFPQSVEIKNIQDGKLMVKAIARFSDVRIGIKEPPSFFTLPFPAGITVINKIKGTTYKIGPNEQPLGQPSAIIPGTMTQSEPQSPTPLDADEHQNRPYWIASFVLAGCTIVFLILAIRVRFRSRTTS